MKVCYHPFHFYKEHDEKKSVVPGGFAGASPRFHRTWQSCSAGLTETWLCYHSAEPGGGGYMTTMEREHNGEVRGWICGEARGDGPAFPPNLTAT